MVICAAGWEGVKWGMIGVKERVSFLEHLVEKMAAAQQSAQIAIERLSWEMAEFKKEMADFKEEMRQFKEEMREFKEDSELDRKLMKKAWGELANKLGTIVEDIAAPNIRRLALTEFGLPEIEDFLVRSSRSSRRGPKRRREFDVVCSGPGKVIFGEMKSTATAEAADAFARAVGEFFDFFPEYEGRDLIGVFASWSLPEEVCGRLSAAGLYGVAMGDDTMEIVARPA